MMHYEKPHQSVTDKYLSYIFFTSYIPLKRKYESYDIKGDLNLSLDI